MQAEVANGLLDNKHSRGTEYTLLNKVQKNPPVKPRFFFLKMYSYAVSGLRVELKIMLLFAND